MSTAAKVLQAEQTARQHGMVEYADELRNLLVMLLFPMVPGTHIIRSTCHCITYQVDRGDWRSLEIS